MFAQKKTNGRFDANRCDNTKNLSSTMKAQESGAGNAIGLVHDTRRHVTWFLRRQSIEGQKHCKNFRCTFVTGQEYWVSKVIAVERALVDKKHDTRKRPAGYPSCLGLFMRGLRFRSTRDFGLWSKIYRSATDTEVSTCTRTRTREKNQQGTGWSNHWQNKLQNPLVFRRLERKR